MSIRPAREADIPALQELLKEILLVHHEARPDLFQAQGQKFSEEDLKEVLEKPDCPVFVYEEDGQVLGHLFCEIRVPDDSVRKPVKALFIEDLCVVQTARGKGIGQQLYQFALNYAREIGCYHLTLNVWNDNQGALQFYEKMGMTAQQTQMEIRL
ncbi:GNAT family N-acetyltransferase [Streptococcus ovis]|uniref:GNAT family N-acetyltransferase n=1 Tax=Streptococcus ovis TaxID=82806 RepID=UPI000371A629|nr:GNAT family N-acetyltransferase [Streptococcus ovis]